MKLLLRTSDRFVDMLLRLVLAGVFFPHGAQKVLGWSGRMPAGQEGFEFHLLALAISFAVMVRGAGMLSVDGAIACRK